jgi:hypothetical protein
MRAGTVMRVAPIVAVRDLASAGPVSGCAARVRLNAMTGTSQAAFAVNRPEADTARAEFLRSAWTVLDDCVAAVGLVVGDGVGVGSGEERVEAPRVEQGGLPRVDALVQVGDAAHHQPARDLFGGLRGAERGEPDLGDLGAGDPSLAFSSWTASVGWP